MHFITVRNGRDAKTVLQQEFLQKLLDFLIIIDNQNMRFTSRSQSPELPYLSVDHVPDRARSLVHIAFGLKHFTMTWS